MPIIYPHGFQWCQKWDTVKENKDSAVSGNEPGRFKMTSEQSSYFLRSTVGDPESNEEEFAVPVPSRAREQETSAAPMDITVNDVPPESQIHASVTTEQPQSVTTVQRSSQPREIRDAHSEETLTHISEGVIVNRNRSLPVVNMTTTVEQPAVGQIGGAVGRRTMSGGEGDVTFSQVRQSSSLRLNQQTLQSDFSQRDVMEPRRINDQLIGNNRPTIHDLNYNRNGHRHSDAWEEQRIRPQAEELYNQPQLVPSMMSRASSRTLDEPRVHLPVFDGKGNWKSFWVKFEFLAGPYGWDVDKKLCQLISCLQEGAMEYVARLPLHVRNDLYRLIAALEQRYGDQSLPETYRASLMTLRKKPQETLQEYAARVERLVSMSYPGLEGTPLYTSIAIEHIVGGLADPNLSYDVLTKKPTTINETLGMISWHECCKGANKRKITSAIRPVGESRPTNNDVIERDVRRAGGQRYVTEERLNEFGRDLKESMTHVVKETVKAQMQVLRPGHRDENREAVPNERNKRNLEGVRTFKDKVCEKSAEDSKSRCYYCHAEGHFARDCPRRNMGNRNVRNADLN